MNFKLDGIIIFVQDVDRLKSFYAGLLKFEIIEEQPSQWLLLRAGSTTIGLHRMGDAYLQEGEEFKVDNNTKLVFELSDDIHKTRQFLIDNGVAMGDVKSFDKYPYLICDGEDAEGNVFQLKRIKV